MVILALLALLIAVQMVLTVVGATARFIWLLIGAVTLCWALKRTLGG